MAFPHDDPTLRQLRATCRWRSPEVADYLRENWPSKEIPGIGRVSGCLTSSKTMGHMGTMSVFERAGFRAAQRDEIRRSDPYRPGAYVVMRKRV